MGWVFGLELHGRRKAPQHRKEQEYYGMGDRDVSPLFSPPLAPHSLRFVTIPLCLLDNLCLLFDVFLLFSLQSLEVYYVCPCVVVTVEWMNKNRLFNRRVQGLVVDRSDPAYD